MLTGKANFYIINIKQNQLHVRQIFPSFKYLPNTKKYINFNEAKLIIRISREVPNKDDFALNKDPYIFIPSLCSQMKCNSSCRVHFNFFFFSFLDF